MAIFESACLGVIWFYLRKRYTWSMQVPSIFILGLLAQLFGLANVMIILPFAQAQEEINHIALPMLLICTPATVLVCMLFKMMEKYIDDEHALMQSEERFRVLVNSIPDLIWLKDVNGVYLACNKMFERFFGAKEADIVGKTDYDFVNKELADSFREHDLNAMAAEKATSNEVWITFADNQHRALLDTTKTPRSLASYIKEPLSKFYFLPPTDW